MQKKWNTYFKAYLQGIRIRKRAQNCIECAKKLGWGAVSVSKLYTCKNITYSEQFHEKHLIILWCQLFKVFGTHKNTHKLTFIQT